VGRHRRSTAGLKEGDVAWLLLQKWMVTSRWFSGERRLGRVRYAPCNHPPKVPGVVVVCDEN
jgi:hypothetical protein